MILSNRDIVNIERYLERCVKSYDIPYLNSFSITVTGEYCSDKKYLRVSLRYDDLIKGRDIIQPRVKEIIKELFELDDKCTVIVQQNFKFDPSLYMKSYIIYLIRSFGCFVY